MKKLAVSLIAPLCLMVSIPDVKARPQRADGPDGGIQSAQRQLRSVKTVRKSHYHNRSAHRTASRKHYSTRVARRGHHTRVARQDSKRYAYNSNSGVGPRPSAWCGWWMRTLLGGGPEYNLAWNWRNYGRPSGPQVGAVVVWRHHVGIITGRHANGQWIVKSGNDGNRVRERPRSVAGAIFRVGAAKTPSTTAAASRRASDSAS